MSFSILWVLTANMEVLTDIFVGERIKNTPLRMVLDKFEHVFHLR